MPETIIFATSNKGKIGWLERALKIAHLTEWSVEGRKLDLFEIQSNDLAEISLSKAKQAYALLQKPVLVMDGGLYIDELNGFPGPFGSFMMEKMGVVKFANLISKFQNRACQFRNVVTFMDSPTSYQQFFDDSGDLFTLTDQIWPEAHPEQWSDLWRIIIASGIGYTRPLASFNTNELYDYTEKRAKNYSSGLAAFVTYLQQSSSTSRMVG